MNEHINARVNDAYLQLLIDAGADKIPHSGRTLLDHLIATCRLLADWRNPAHVCTAGLFHSIYGTRTFRVRAIDHSERRRVRRVIGQRAEQLAYLFGACDRDCFFLMLDEQPVLLHDKVQDQAISVSRDTLHALIEVEVANILEQVPYKKRISPVVRDTYRRQCETARPVISDAAYRHYQKTFAE